MERIIKDRGRGKTTELIRLSNEKQIPIMTMNRDSAQFIEHQAKMMGVKIPAPFFTRDYNRYKGRKNNRVLVDELDQVLEALLDIQIEGYTLTAPNKY